MCEFVNSKCTKVSFKFKQFPFGIKVAAAIFQQVMAATLCDCDFTVVYLDDILIKSELQEQHFKHIRKNILVNKQIQRKG